MIRPMWRMCESGQPIRAPSRPRASRAEGCHIRSSASAGACAGSRATAARTPPPPGQHGGAKPTHAADLRHGAGDDGKGYAGTKVEDIVAAAAVAKPAFYQFLDKEHAFLEAQQFPTQFILGRCVE